jgi:ABC-type glutathione transport system ATPase component
MTGAVIQLHAVTKRYVSGPLWSRRRITALDSIDLAIAEGETLALVGESGSGKTTLGRLCLGRIIPTSGLVLLDGRPFSAWRDRLCGRLAAVLQHPQWSLNPRLRVGTSVAEPLVVGGAVGRQEISGKVSEMLDRVGLARAMAQRYPHELSGGQRQRVAIARALITTPRLVVFDEPVSALDVSVQAQVLNLIKELQQRVGFSALFISHDLAAARYVAARVCVIYRGKLVETVPAARLYEVASHPYTRSLQEASGLSCLARQSPGAAGMPGRGPEWHSGERQH